MTPVIHDNIVHRDRLLKKARKLDQASEEQRNKTFRSIRRAKSTFFHDSLEIGETHGSSLKTLKERYGFH